MLLRPVHRESATARENDDQRFSRCRDRFEQFLLGRRQADIHSISSEKPGNHGLAFFTFESRGEPHHGDNHVGRSRGCDSAVEKIRRLPE